MKRIAILGCLAAVALPVTAADGARRVACSMSGSRTVLATSSAKIVAKRGIANPSYRVTRYYGCRYRTDRFFRLAIVGEPGVFEDSVSHARLAGPFASVATQYEDPAGENVHASVKVVDLRDGRKPVRYSALPDQTNVFVTDLVLAPSATVAWIERRTTFPEPGKTQNAYEVHWANAAGQHLLDSGPDVQPGSLARAGSTLYWTRGAQPRSAQLIS